MRRNKEVASVAESRVTPPNAVSTASTRPRIDRPNAATTGRPPYCPERPADKVEGEPAGTKARRSGIEAPLLLHGKEGR